MLFLVARNLVFKYKIDPVDPDWAEILHTPLQVNS
jgi:hypothetical protein